jgi:hypothetical protein
LDDGDDAGADGLAASTQRYKTLCNTADELGVVGLAACRGTLLWGAVMDAFVRARMDARAISESLPYARAALNAELLDLYDRLDELANARSAK